MLIANIIGILDIQICQYIGIGRAAPISQQYIVAGPPLEQDNDKTIESVLKRAVLPCEYQEGTGTIKADVGLVKNCD